MSAIFGVITQDIVCDKLIGLLSMRVFCQSCISLSGSGASTITVLVYILRSGSDTAFRLSSATEEAR
jgi:hypothetical protein